MNTSNNNLKEMQDHAWSYFEFHASQRMILFRFYIAILVFYSGAIGYLFVRFYLPGLLAEIAVFIASIAFIVLTIIFQLLDRRNCQLISYSKAALRNIEKFYSYNIESANIFNLEDQDAKNKKSRISHRCCFTAIFVLSYIAAVVAIIATVISYFYFPK